MNTNTVSEAVNLVILNFVTQKRPFSAFDVTTFLRNLAHQKKLVVGGLQVFPSQITHNGANGVRSLVHRRVGQTPADFTAHSMTAPNGQTYFLYHFVGAPAQKTQKVVKSPTQKVRRHPKQKYWKNVEHYLSNNAVKKAVSLKQIQSALKRYKGVTCLDIYNLILDNVHSSKVEKFVDNFNISKVLVQIN